jgi:hypothetical protein
MVGVYDVYNFDPNGSRTKWKNLEMRAITLAGHEYGACDYSIVYP